MPDTRTPHRRSRVGERLAPARLGRSFRWLLASSWTSQVGDGIALAAGPLLVAAQTDDPLLIAMAALVQWLPPLVFGLAAGLVSDRLDRRRVVIVVDLVRVAVLVVLGLSIVTGAVSIAVVLGCLFALGTAEVFADNTAQTLLPTLVRRDDLAVGNARLYTGFITFNMLAGPPLGAALFAVGALVPFAAQAVLLLAAAGLVSRITLPPRSRPGRAPLVADVAEGLRWTWRHAGVRTLLLTILIFNVTFGAAWSVLVLYATERLGLGAIGFGLIATVQAVGGLAATAAYGWITRRLTLGAIMRIGLIIETLTHLGLALTTVPAVAMVIFFCFGAHAFVWGATSTTMRQRVVPVDLQGRVGSVYSMGVYGGLVVGAGVGGILARGYGVTGPFWFAFVGSAVFVALIWRQLRHLDADGAVPERTGRERTGAAGDVAAAAAGHRDGSEHAAGDPTDTGIARTETEESRPR